MLGRSRSWLHLEGADAPSFFGSRPGRSPMIEEDLRALFARAEGQPMATEGLRSRIDRAATRRRVRQVTTQLSAVVVLVVAAVLSLPLLSRVVVPVADAVAGDPWPTGVINVLMI